MLDINIITNFISKNKVDRIIVNGGDPLMVPPEYYYKILNFIRKNHLNTELSFTTNLWDFFINPIKWSDLFKQKEVYICTSFQYGGERRLKNGQEYSENMFKKTMETFFEHIGYVPKFISVITHKNEDMSIKTVELAKELNTECKLNPLIMSGKANSYYPFYKAMEIYLNVIEKSLSQYEFNCKEIYNLLNKNIGCCPYNRKCIESIRTISPDGLIHSCGCFNDQHYTRKENNLKTYELEKESFKNLKKDNMFLKTECLSCELFKLCNSCYERISTIKQMQDIETHCSGMKKLKSRILNDSKFVYKNN